FNPSTTIMFGLPSASYTKVIIYNSLGQAVRTLVDKNLVAGYHTYSWDGKNNNGSSVASGLYIYRLVSGDKQLTKKMLLLK
ncbi:MAG: T9SS type A sorting domain-containing protein, partial [Calditrichia bacterium]|nr:T9SS type A sorting domain-containing protein [Calditrichia bacterium]